jgi:hypothetical protein
MDVKSAINSILPPQAKPINPVDRTIKSENAEERDGNGQEQYSRQQQDRDSMSEEEFQKALETLKSFPAIKEHNLQIEVITQESSRFVLLKEASGKLVRKISEAELWTLPQFRDGEKPKGQLLRKTA